MRIALLAAWVLVAGSAEAGFIPSTQLLWRIAVLEPTPITPHAFRISTGVDAYIEHTTGPGNPRTWTASDGPNVAALFADLADNVDGEITFSTDYFSHTESESYFWTRQNVFNPFIVSPKETSHAIDLYGWTVQHVAISVRSPDETPRRYSVEIFGLAPEPSSALLFAIGLCGFAHRYRFCS